MVTRSTGTPLGTKKEKKCILWKYNPTNVKPILKANAKVNVIII